MHRVACGIDFGCNSCSVGIALLSGTNEELQKNRFVVEIVPNEFGKRAFPSVVAFEGNRRFFADLALPICQRSPDNAVVDIKSFMGVPLDDVSYKTSNLRARKVVDDFGDDDDETYFAEFQVNAYGTERRIIVETIAAMLLRFLIRQAKSYVDDVHSGACVSRYVISVPAMATEDQLQAMQDAISIAGISSCCQFMHETTAAAMDYGYHRVAPMLLEEETRKNVGLYGSSYAENMFRGKKHVLIVDIGYSCTQACVASLHSDAVFMVSQASNEAQVGCRDFDHILYGYLATIFKDEHHIDIDDIPKSKMKLLMECTRVKEVLSANTVASVDVDGIYEDVGFHTTVTRELFEELCQPLQDFVVEPIRQVMCSSESGKPTKLSSYQVVGGGSHIPFVRKWVESILEGNGVSTHMHPKECVARGCTLRAAMDVIAGLKDDDESGGAGILKHHDSYYEVDDRFMSYVSGLDATDELLTGGMDLDDVDDEKSLVNEMERMDEEQRELDVLINSVESGALELKRELSEGGSYVSYMEEAEKNRVLGISEEALLGVSGAAECRLGDLSSWNDELEKNKSHLRRMYNEEIEFNEVKRGIVSTVENVKERAVKSSRFPNVVKECDMVLELLKDAKVLHQVFADAGDKSTRYIMTKDELKERADATIRSWEKCMSGQERTKCSIQ